MGQTLSVKQHKLLDSLTIAAGTSDYPNIHSILISRNGQLVYERYFNGWNKDSLHDSRSSFKSITSLLTGIAIDKGLVRDVRQKVYSFFPEYRINDVRKTDMTLENLLQMESGFDCEEFIDGKDCETNMTATKDWVRFSLDLPMKDKPGSVWAYTSCDPVIISGIITRVAKMSTMDFARKYLFDPMDIKKYRWTVDPAGYGMTAGSFYMLSSDMLKIGEMVRKKGIWNGHRIVSDAWLKKSTIAPILIPDFSFVRFSKSSVAIPQPTYYGYYWYREEIRTGALRENVLFASGNGGQYIMIIENLGLVVVFTQGNYNSWKAKKAFDLLARFILPAYEP
jgi:CubicO group peptidase (beta-lactamase class C family)